MSGIGWGRSKGERIYACIWLIHFIVQQKLTQHFKTIILKKNYSRKLLRLRAVLRTSRMSSPAPGQKSLCDFSDSTVSKCKVFPWQASLGKIVVSSPDMIYNQCIALSERGYSQATAKALWISCFCVTAFPAQTPPFGSIFIGKSWKHFLFFWLIFLSSFPLLVLSLLSLPAPRLLKSQDFIQGSLSFDMTTISVLIQSLSGTSFQGWNWKRRELMLTSILASYLYYNVVLIAKSCPTLSPHHGL